MLKTLRKELIEDRTDKTISSFVTESNLNAVVRESMLDNLGDVSDEELLSDEDLEKLIEEMPETPLDDDTCLMEGTAKTKDEDGNEKDVDMKEVEEMFLPETEIE